MKLAEIKQPIKKRAKAQDELQDERNKLQSVVDALEYGLTIQDKDFNIIYQNEPSQIPFGAHLGEKCYRVYAGRETVCEGCPVEQAFKDGKSRTAERKHVSPSGEVSFWENTANPIRDSNGNIVSCLEITRDITERKKAEQALADETTRRSILVDQSLDGIVVLDENAKVYEANQRFAEMLGYTPEEVRELHTWDWDTQWSREELLEMGRKVDATGYHVETYHRRKDGTTIDVEISINGAMYSGQKLIFCVSRDITERKQMEEALQTEKNKLQSVINAMEDDLSIQDKDYNIIYQNEPSRISSGGDCTGEKCYRAYENRDKVCDGCPVEKAYKDGKSHTSERKWVKPSGEVIFWETTANPIRDAGGNIVSCLEIARNITERKQAEDLFKTVTNSSPVGIYIVQDRKFILANPRFQKLTGYTEEELLGMNSLDLVLPEDREAVRKKAVKMLKGERSSPYQFRVIHKSGSARWVMETVTSIQYRGRRAILGNYMDITERRETEEKIRQQNEFLNTILDALTHPFYVLDANDYTIKMGNLATKAGNLAENPTCYALTHQSDQPCRGANHTCPLKEVKKTKEPIVVEHIHYDADGNARNIEVHGYPIFDTKGNVVQMIEYSLDITERKQAEEALRESEEFRSSLLTNSPNPIGVINPDSSIRYVNPALEKLTGFSAAELIGKKAPYPYWTQETLKKTTIGFRKAMRQGDRRAEELFQKKNGERFWVKITSMPVMNDGEFKYLLTNWVDITKRKQVEEALRQSEKKYKNMVEATSDLIWEADERGVFTFVSPRIKDILGYEASEVIGKIRTLDLIPKAEAREWLKRFKEINAKKEPFFGFEITNLHKNGTPVLFEISGISNFDNAGNFKGYVGVNKDITERKRMEEQLMLTDRLASIGELASGIAHELNNPLTSVIGFSQLLLEEDLPENLKEDLGTIYSEAQRASTIVKNLLTFARKHAPMRQISQINNILEDVLKLRAYEHKVNNIGLEKNFAADLPEIMVDYFQMQQVFLNLIVNAESAMLETNGKGKLTITTGRVNHTVKVSIADNGPGIARENLRRVFDPFFTTKEVGKGTGLGLSICHGIVTGHGGKIYAEGKAKEGAKFVVELPLNGNST